MDRRLKVFLKSKIFFLLLLGVIFLVLSYVAYSQTPNCNEDKSFCFNQYAFYGLILRFFGIFSFGGVIYLLFKKGFSH